VDIGAHIGGFSKRVKSNWPNARVIAIEPGPDNADLYRRNLDGSGGVHLYAAALVKAGGPAQVTLSEIPQANTGGRWTWEVGSGKWGASSSRMPPSQWHAGSDR
jgi:FkbM family methyltransferase